MKYKGLFAIGLVVLMALVLTACAGQAGPEGPQGPQGPAGPQGPEGPAGASLTEEQAQALETAVLNLLDNAVKYSKNKIQIEVEVWSDGDGQAQGTGHMPCPDAQGIAADYGFLGDRFAHTQELKQAPYFASFQSNSWGASQTTSYTSASSEMDDIVWRLPPSYNTSKDDPELKAQYEAIGESNRMTLKFRKPM